MTGRSDFSLVVNDDVTVPLVRRIVEALDAGTYRNAIPAESRIRRSGVVDVPMLVCDGSGLPPVTFTDPMWNCEDSEDAVLPAFLADVMDDAPAIAMARACLSAPRIGREDVRPYHPVLLALAAVSARDRPKLHEAVGASAASPWGEASSCQAASIVGGSVSPTPTSGEIASFVPRSSRRR